mgnify:CR=1 FL=1
MKISLKFLSLEIPYVLSRKTQGIFFGLNKIETSYHSLALSLTRNFFDQPLAQPKITIGYLPIAYLGFI